MTTHEVFNQVEPLPATNLFTGNVALQDALKLHWPKGGEGVGQPFESKAADYESATQSLAKLGEQVGSDALREHARLSHLHLPQLHTHDVRGRRVDEVEFHPSYHALMQASTQAGLHASAWQADNLPSHLTRAAGFMLFTELEPASLCPISMTYAVTPALRGNSAILNDWFAGLSQADYDARLVPFNQKKGLTMGMAMTEKQGGSDVRANTTQAQWDGADAWGERYRLTGHKWFCSAPMSDAFLVLAQLPEGVTCFFLPRVLPDGSRNHFFIQRLKDKLGNKANASSEIELENALAWRVGEPGRGIAQILEMGMFTRLDCALGTSGLMRQALTQALHHTSHRFAFGKPLIAQDLMRNVLADLALESEASTALAMRLAAAFGARLNSQEALLARVLTPIAKFWICKRGSAFAQEAMECLGGNGYIEASGHGMLARIYREMPVNSIWEGAGNIMAIDLLRSLRKGDVADALQNELALSKGFHPALDRAVTALPQKLDLWADELHARRLAEAVALVVQASLLARSAPASVAQAFIRSRLEGHWGFTYGSLDAQADFSAILQRAAVVH